MSQVLLAERINALRDEKNITVEDIERAGISRSRYYRFVRGQTQISVVDLSRLLKLLAVSFSELFAGVIADPYQLSIGDLAKCTETELRQKQAEIAQTAASVGYPTAEMVAIVIDIIIDRRCGVDYRDKTQRLYDRMNSIQAFTIFEMRVFSLIATDLTPKRFFKLYRKFAHDVQVFRDYMPGNLFETSLMIHMTALNQAVIWPKKLNVTDVWLTLEGIMRQPARRSNVEILLLQRFTGLLRTYLTMDSEVVAAEIGVFLMAAQQMGVREMTMNTVQTSLVAVWTRLQLSKQQLHAQKMAETLPAIITDLTLQPRSQSFGEALRRRLKDKHIRVRSLEALGFSKSKLYRVFEDVGTLMIDEMLDLMRIIGFETGDIVAVLMWFPLDEQNARTNLYGASHSVVSPAVVRQSVTDIEDYYENEVYADVRADVTWFGTERATQVATAVANLLRELDEWHEKEYRLVKVGLMVVTNEDELAMWFRRMRQDHRDNRATRVYTDRQIDAVEYAIFGALFKGDFDRVRQLVRLALTNNPSLTNTLRYTAWRWRVESYRLYEQFAANPLETIRQLKGLYNNYAVLLGDGPLVQYYQRRYDALWQQYR